MKYHCGHNGCDICGARECAGTDLRSYHDCIACDSCVTKAVKFAVNAAETFGGTMIDPARPCGNLRNQDEPSEKILLKNQIALCPRCGSSWDIRSEHITSMLPEITECMNKETPKATTPWRCPRCRVKVTYV